MNFPIMISKVSVLLWSAAFVLLLAAVAHAADFTGHVVSVLDGDTIEVLHNQHSERIRLRGIDCPEKGQAYGKRAKQATSVLAFEKKVTLHAHGLDKYGRTLAEVLLPDGTNVNHTLVKEGWCWWYRKYASGDTVLEGLEKEAREARKGLWADPRPVPPWKWRKREPRFTSLRPIQQSVISPIHSTIGFARGISIDPTPHQSLWARVADRGTVTTARMSIQLVKSSAP